MSVNMENGDHDGMIMILWDDEDNEDAWDNDDEDDNEDEYEDDEDNDDEWILWYGVDGDEHGDDDFV